MNPFTSASASVSVHRQSLAPNQLFGAQTPATASVQRRSSVYSRPSGAGPLGQHNFFTQQAPVKRPDPRVPMSKATKERMTQELLDYMTQNNFEFDMKHSIRLVPSGSPTQNDFNFMFQWLYRRVDPGYKFQKNIDVELPQLMKQLRYPYGTDISKSHIYPITPQHWPKFLLMFHWIMQLAQMLDNFARGAYDDACAEAGIDVAGDRIVFRFLFSGYQDWLQVSSDQDDDVADAALEPHRQAMAEEFSRINARYEEDLKVLEEENEKLRAQIEEVERSTPDVAKLDKVFDIITDDIQKFEDYNKHMQAKIEKNASRTKILEDEISKIEDDLQKAEQERQNLQNAVDRQGLNIQDIDRINTEKERLTKSHDDAVASLEQVNKLVLEKEIEAARKLEDLEAATKRYNTLGYQTSIIPSTAVNAKGQNYELVLQLTEPAVFSASTSRRSRQDQHPSSTEQADRLLAKPLTGYQPQSLLPSHLADLRGHARTFLVPLRKFITERRRHTTDDAFSDHELIHQVGEMLQDKRNEIENLNCKLSNARDLYNALKEEHQTASNQMTAKREKTEKELEKMRDGLERGVRELEVREMEVGVAWDNMVSEAERVREELHGGIERILEDVVRFKLHVKGGLELFEGWVGEEVEVEEGEWAEAAEMEGVGEYE